MSEFSMNFQFGGYDHRAMVVVTGSYEDELEFHLDGLYYLHPLLPEERGEYGGKKEVWLNVSYLLDTPAADLILQAANRHVYDGYEDHCRENFVEPEEDYE